MTFNANSANGVRSHHLAAVMLALAGLLAAMVLFGPNIARSGSDWEVLSVSGKAEWREQAGEGAWRRLERNTGLADGSEIRTGEDGSVVVAKGLDRIEMQAATSIVVAARKSGGAMETDQTTGSATYTVEKRPSGTFAVRTPYVVAVVKGTQFSVEVNEEDTSVSVDEGRVSVSDERSGDKADVNPGQTARASKEKAGLDVGKTAARAGKKAAKAPAKAATTAAETAPAEAATTEDAAAQAGASTGSKGKSGDKGGGRDDGRDGGGNDKDSGGGSDKGNAGGNGKSDAGGNGKGNAGGNGKSNAGGKGKSNAGGNGKGNGGGNGGGKGREDKN